MQQCMEDNPLNPFDNDYNITCLPKLQSSSSDAVPRVQSNVMGIAGMSVLVLVLSSLLRAL